MKDISGIYRIVNIKNNKIYIGSSKNINKRKYEHFNLLSKNSHDNDYLQKSYNKYGKNSFKFEVIEYINNINELLIREQYWINKYVSYNRNIGYNICEIAGKPPSQAGKIPWNKNKKGLQKCSDKRKLELSKAMIGNSYGKSLAGRKLSDKHKKKIGKSNSKKILNITENKVFNSFTDASIYYNISRPNISSACNGKRKTAGGYEWKYYEDK